MRPLLITHSNLQTPIDVAGQGVTDPGNSMFHRGWCYIVSGSLLNDCFVSPVTTIAKGCLLVMGQVGRECLAISDASAR